MSDQHKTVKVRPGRPEDKVTMRARAKYNPVEGKWQQLLDRGEGGAVLWQESLDRFWPDPEIQEFLQMILGSGLMGGNKNRFLVFLHGEGMSGKSMILRMLNHVMGDYATSRGVDFLRPRKGTTNNPLAEAAKKRYVTIGDVGENYVLGDGEVKLLTGDDYVNAELKYAGTVTFIPQFLVIIATNHPVKIDSVDGAVQRRIVVIPCSRAPEASSNNVDRTNLLVRKSTDAFFAWVVEGYEKQVKRGITADLWPDKIRGASASFFQEMGPFAGVFGRYFEYTGNLDDFVRLSEIKQIVAMHKRDEKLPSVSDNKLGRQFRLSFPKLTPDQLHEEGGKHPRIYRGVRKND